MSDSEKLDIILSELKDVKWRVTGIEMTLENETNGDINLLAENHRSLIDKLNQAI